MSAMSDAIIAYAILKKFKTPITNTPAYKMGLVDEDGNPTREAKYNQSERAHDAYTLLDKLVFRLKRLWKKMPAFAKLIGGYSAALSFVNESNSESFGAFDHLDSNVADHWASVVSGDTILPMSESIIVQIAEDSELLARLVEAYQNGTQDAVCEEMTASAIAGNSVSSGQVQGLATEPIITKKKQKEIQDAAEWETAKGRKEMFL